MTLDLPDYTKPIGGIDRHGNPLQSLQVPPVWFHDDFEGGTFKWGRGFGTVEHVAIPHTASATSPVYTGTACMRITSGTGTIGQGLRYITLPPTTENIAISTWFSMLDTAAFSNAVGNNVFTYLDIYTGDAKIRVRVAYNPSDGKWYVYVGGSLMWQYVHTQKLSAQAHHYLKLVFNPTTLKYIRLHINHDTVDISDYSFTSSSSTGDVRTIIKYMCWGASGQKAVLYVDDVMVTYNEP